jgi:hypothetical protein
MASEIKVLFTHRCMQSPQFFNLPFTEQHSPVQTTEHGMILALYRLRSASITAVPPIRHRQRFTLISVVRDLMTSRVLTAA